MLADASPKHELSSHSQSLRARQTNQNLDNVPIRNRTTSGPAELSALGHGGHGAHQSFSLPLDERSYSPTPSDLEALEVSFYDYENQSTPSLTDAADTEYSKSASQDTSSPISSLSPSTVLEGLNVHTSHAQSLEDRLRMVWPKTPRNLKKAPFVVKWEVLRVALHCGIDTSRLDSLQYQDSWKDQDIFWADLKDTPCLNGYKLPVKSDPRAWRMCLESGSTKESVILTATMHTTNSRVGAPMTLQMHPLKREQSSRLYRHFGYDRFLEVQIPSVDSWPNPTRERELEAVAARWLTDKPHDFMDRQWAAFYIRDRQLKVEVPGVQPGVDSKTTFYDRILFFAERGTELVDHEQAGSACILRQNTSQDNRRACSRNTMLDWLLNWQKNESQSYLKLFHRVALGLSKTAPVVLLQKHQIRHQPKDLVSPETSEVMNDGAARISPSLMKKVRDVLGLQTIPSAIQGRLGSAKGMWVVDVAETSQTDWIETYPSQRKWECNLSEEAHRTLEVRSWSTDLTSASLNIQFLPILEDRAIDPEAMRATFVQNMATEAERELEDVKLALQHPELFRKWARETSPQAMQRLLSRAVPYLGGLPDSHDDIMSFLVDGGFEPVKLRFLQDLVFQRQRQRGETMKQELKIKVAKSTYAYMLVDFWNVLEPDEVHLCFSTSFPDGTEGELSDLDGVDVLVARAPAHLPSDVQKVRAVFKSELRHLRDVIIFSAKGDIPLAAKLSGGDYDGDKAWVCWDSEIVNNFKNHPLPPKPDFARYLEKDRATLDDLHGQYGDGYIDAMIQQSFRFNLTQKYLGPCTAYKEKLCYHRYRVSDQKAIKFSWLLSELADQPKQGILFGQEQWNRFRDDIVGTRRELSQPAYKTGKLPHGSQAKKLHVIDFLMCQAKQVVDSTLTNLHQFLRSTGASATDRDIVRYWDQFETKFGGSKWFRDLRDGLQHDVKVCLAEWNRLIGSGVLDYRQKVEQAHAAWRGIKPRVPSEDSHLAALVREILHEDRLVSDLGQWELLKASWAFKHHHRRRFVWQMAGRQLQAIKALSVKCDSHGNPLLAAGAPIPVITNMYAALRPDNTYIKRLMALGNDGELAFNDQLTAEAGQIGLQGLPWSSGQDEDD